MKFNGSGSDRFGGDPFKQHEQEMGKNALAIVGKQFESVFNLCIVLFIRQIPFQVVLTKCDYQMVNMFCKMKTKIATFSTEFEMDNITVRVSIICITTAAPLPRPSVLPIDI